MAMTRRTMMASAGASALAACAQPAEEAPPTTAAALGGVQRLDARLDAIIAPDAVVEELGSGFQWSEGPLWIAEDGGYLLFTDVPGNVMYKWAEGEGATEFLRPSGFAGADAAHLREPGANGLTREVSGAVLMADCGNRAISRLDLASKTKTRVAERYDGKRFNSPNDVIVHSSGAIYFTDPPYGLAGMADSPLRETAFMGVYRIGTDGAVQLVDDQLAFPNGIALSPDEQTLYVACSNPERAIIQAYTLGANGLPTASRVFFDATAMVSDSAPGLPDGMKVDANGNLFATGPGGVMVIAPDATLLGIIGAGRAIANCAFGEADGKTLFMTAHDRLARARLL